MLDFGFAVADEFGGGAARRATVNGGSHGTDDAAAVFSHGYEFLFGGALRAFHGLGDRFFSYGGAFAGEIEQGGATAFGTIRESRSGEEKPCGDGDESNVSKLSFHIRTFLRLIRGPSGESLNQLLRLNDRFLAMSGTAGSVSLLSDFEGPGVL